MSPAPAADAPLLEVRGLTVTLGDPRVQAVAGIDFSVHRGEIVGLAGESGSGKSVTALALTRLLPATAAPRYAGTVRLSGAGNDLLGMRERALRAVRGRRIGYIFQEPSSGFNPVYTIGNHLDEILKLAGVPSRHRRGAALEALSEAGIEPSSASLRAWPGSYSGGMLQRAALACALLQGPELLVADEPTTALDASTQKRMVDLLGRLNRERGMAILFISHDLGLLRQICARILVMHRGLVVEQGTASEVLNNPSHPYTRQLVAAAPKLRIQQRD